MGMYIDFYKVVTKEEYDNHKDTCCSDYRELPYTKNLGDIINYTKITICEDTREMFKIIGLDINNYNFRTCDSNTLVYSKISNYMTNDESFYEIYQNEYLKARHIAAKNIVELKYKYMPTYDEIESVYYVKYVLCQKISWNYEEDVYTELLRIQELVNSRAITKTRFEELINYIPKLKYIVYDYYKIPMNLDFDIFYINW